MITDIPAVALLHGLCAAVFVVLAALILLRGQASSTGIWLAGCCTVTAAWALSVAVQWRAPLLGLPGWLELIRSLAWYGFVLHLYRRSVSRRVGPGERMTSAGIVVAFGVAALLPLVGLPEAWQGADWPLEVLARIALAVCNILLLENLYFNTAPDRRWHINLLCVALGGLFLYDLFLYANALLFRQIPVFLFAGRAGATAMVAPLLAVAAARNPRWNIDIHVSRSVVFHSATLVVSGLFLLGLAVAGEVFRKVGAEWGVVVETMLVFGGLLAVAVLLGSGSARSRMRAVFVDHFFSHRYDYRREWMRCIATLSAPDTYVGLHTRAIRAVAEMVDSPGGVLFIRDGADAAFLWAGSWNLPAATAPVASDHPLIAGFKEGEWTVALETLPVGEWWPELPGLWLAQPLNHLGRLIGFVLLARSRAGFKLDAEVYDLLRIVGREVASHVAEQRAAQVLTQSKQLHDYGKRFAFVVHDIKNVSGQLSMLLENAAAHADNPEFQRDMLSTVRASVARITRTLAKLQAQEREVEETLLVPIERLSEIVAGVAKLRGLTVPIDHDGRRAGVAMEAASFDAVVAHLLDNAIEASAATVAEKTPVRITLRHDARSVVIDIVDRGPGMSPEFIRDTLFRPFASTKAGGHGIGAFQARELLREAGGDLLAISRPREGTTMRLLLPSVGMPVETVSRLTA
jgi:putative PEP-CTERM system histidine kinase